MGRRYCLNGDVVGFYIGCVGDLVGLGWVGDLVGLETWLDWAMLG